MCLVAAFSQSMFLIVLPKSARECLFKCVCPLWQCPRVFSLQLCSLQLCLRVFFCERVRGCLLSIGVFCVDLFEGVFLASVFEGVFSL